MSKSEDPVGMEVLEEQHRLGYECHPVEPDEFGDWQAEQVWPADWGDTGEVQPAGSPRT